ncbi:unnamed protein product [Musa acuminata subsp. burmannicoides]
MKYSFLDHETLPRNFGPISPTSINHIFNAADCIIEDIYLHRVHFRFYHCCPRTRDESNKQFRNILYFKISMQVEGITSSACLVDSICIYRNIKTIDRGRHDYPIKIQMVDPFTVEALIEDKGTLKMISTMEAPHR